MRKFALFTTLLISLMLACTLPGSSPEPLDLTTPPAPDAGGSIPTTAPSSADAPQATAPDSGGDSGTAPPAEPTAVPSPTSIPSNPVSVQEGLASLNSYLFIVESVSYTNTVSNQNIIHIETQKSEDLDARLTRYLITVPVPGEAPEQTETYLYSIGNQQCSGSDVDGWSFESYTAQEKELQDLLGGMVDILPLIDDPSYVGSESMNGVLSNHFSFQISGVGAESGVDVIANQGDYWLAQDGQYIVRYRLVLETRDVNTEEIVHIEVFMDLTQVNQPLNIAFPQGCLDAQANP
ncbi:MAG: hypothetical protein JW726_04765 [Anaerolineales bacterium]|nr:hypothetical protein [Anaerolineales bacterium]